MKENIRDAVTLGVDLGGTKVEIALVDLDGQILAVRKYPTNPGKGPEGVINDVLACIKGCLGEVKLETRALGIGIAGQVSVDGVVRFAPNLRWRNVPLRKRLEDNLKMPVVVVNDVRAAAFGEWRFGSGRGLNDVVVLFVGTGVGGGVISNGKMLTGCANFAGELGHMTIKADGRKCYCPNWGCLEAYVGGWAIAERTQEAVQADPIAGQMLLLLAGEISKITAVTLKDAYRRSDELALRLVEETGRLLSVGVVGIVNAFNPCLVILGGGVIEGLPELIEIVEDIVQSRGLESTVEGIKFEKAALGNNAGVIGAAALAQEKLDL